MRSSTTAFVSRSRPSGEPYHAIAAYMSARSLRPTTSRQTSGRAYEKTSRRIIQEADPQNPSGLGWIDSTRYDTTFKDEFLSYF
jgi:hypothetical protein